MKKFFSIVISVIMLAGIVNAQQSLNVKTNETKQTVTFDSARLMAETTSVPDGNGGKVKKHYFTAVSAMLLDSALIGGWNRYVSKAAWAKVTWDDAKKFYERGMTWDRDWYWTNFVLHPYQGSLYYMGARDSNLNQVESFAVTAAGSAIWEWFFETNAPSKNDMVYTTVGAFAMGEMLYRLSIEAGSKSRAGGNIINPNSMYTSWITGERPRGTTGNIQDFSLKFGAGAAKTYTTFSKYFNDSRETFPGFVNAEFNVVYNDPYGWDSNVPYSQFELNMGGMGGFGSGEGENTSEEKLMYNVYITSNGMLFSRAPDFGPNKDTTIGIVFDYDFMWHSLMQLASLAPGFAIKQRIRHSGRSKSEWQLHLDGILLGTTDYYYWRRGKALRPAGLPNPGDDVVWCDYSYTYGAETVLKYKYTSRKGKILDTDFHGYAMYAFDTQMQRGMHEGWELIGITNINGELPVSDKVNLGLGNQIYMKKTINDEIPELFQIVYTGTVYARIKIK